MNLLAYNVVAQADSVLYQSIVEFQKQEDAFYKDKKTPPLSKKERKHFTGHKFYPIDLDYVVEAKLELFEKEDTVVMATSAGKEKLYTPYAKAVFEIHDTVCELIVYQSLSLRKLEEYKDYLFLPFRDLTSGKTSYGGGKYLDLKISDGDTVVLNFNLAYNPYCAYTTGYSCTIPPKENTLKIGIYAGLMAPEDH